MSTVAPPVVTPPELHDLLTRQPNIRLLDVRTPAEFAAVHIRGAYNVPLDSLGEHGREIRAHVQDPVVLVCQSGQRSRQADAALRAAGMANLHLLDGGVNAWIATGHPVMHGPKRVSLERQVRMAAGSLAAAGGLLALALHPLWALVPAGVGSGLVFAGVTNTCTMSLLLAKLPYNRRPPGCDVPAMVTALKLGAPPSLPS